jgi:hypothetical protein
LDPGDNLYVIRSDDDDDYIVLEGNRRLSALKVLNNPDELAGTELKDSVKKSLSRAAIGFNRKMVEPIRCVKFEDREAAKDWIYRRHTGFADGEGRIPWGPLEIQRFEGDRSILDILDFVGRNGDFTEAEWQTTKTAIESRKSSNLARLLESQAGRNHLSISISAEGNERTPLLASDPEWALGVLKRLIEDVRDGTVDSRDLNKARDIEKYFEELPKELQPRASKKIKATAFKNISIKPLSNPNPSPPATQSPPAKDPKKPKTQATPKLRVNLAPKRHLFVVPNSPKGERLLNEASNLDANAFAIASAFVLRSFIELAINDYCQKHKIPEKVRNKKGEMENVSLTERAKLVKKHVLQDDPSKEQDFRHFTSTIITTTSSTSIQSLNGFVHNKFQIPTGDALRSAWDCSVPLFIASFGAAQ